METILIIEDDPSMLRGLKDNFEQRGFTVLTAADGEKLAQPNGLGSGTSLVAVALKGQYSRMYAALSERFDTRTQTQGIALG